MSATVAIHALAKWCGMLWEAMLPALRKNGSIGLEQSKQDGAIIEMASKGVASNARSTTTYFGGVPTVSDCAKALTKSSPALSYAKATASAAMW